MQEPKQAFPYKPPSKEVYERFQYIFEINTDLPERALKNIFDKVFALFFLILSLPVLLFIKISYFIEGLLIKENKGPTFFFYYAVSQGRIFRKYKIRLIKEKYIDSQGSKRGDWLAYSNEWIPGCRTFTGNLVKKFYIDELPQFYSVLKGDMSIVGPRPISVMHYERDCKQGNVSRKLLKGGMLGLGHIKKGTIEMGNPIFEYEYIDKYINDSDFNLLKLDLYIIFKGVILMLKGEGH